MLGVCWLLKDIDCGKVWVSAEERDATETDK
jgi:hypothetical protein